MVKNYDKESTKIFEEYSKKQKKIENEINIREEKEKLLQEELKKIELEMVASLNEEDNDKRLIKAFEFKKKIKVLKNDISENNEEIQFLRDSITGLFAGDILKMVNDLEKVESKYDEQLNAAIEKLNKIKEEEEKIKNEIVYIKGRKQFLKQKCFKYSSNVLKGANVNGEGKNEIYLKCLANPNIVYETLRNIIKNR